MGFSLSATAPQFLPEQERQEREALSPEELARLREDLCYNNHDDDDHDDNSSTTTATTTTTTSDKNVSLPLVPPPPPANNDSPSSSNNEAEDYYHHYNRKKIVEETLEMKQQGMKELYQCIEQMNAREKLAYKEALATAPDLVQEESDPLAFLRCEKFNAKAAATRLVEYWKQRKSLFGPNKAYQKMMLQQQDGRGALNEEDRSILESGHFMILPRSKGGHAVLFFDGAPQQNFPRNGVLRVWFYLLHVATRDENVQRNGYIIINSIKGFNVSKHFDRILGKKSFELVNTAMPAQLRTSHACMGHSMPAIQIVAPSAKQMAGKHIRLRSVCHAGSDEEMIHGMEQYGLIANHICHHVGGNYTKEQFVQWIQQQEMMEREREREKKNF